MKKEGKRGLLAEGVLGLFTALMLVLGYLYYARSLDETTIIAVGDIVYVLFALVAAGFGIAAVRTYGMNTPEGKLLFLLTLVPITDALAGTLWAIYEVGLGIMNPYPSPADAVWFFFYVFGIAAFIYALHKVRKFITPRKVAFTLVVWGVAVAAIYSATLQPIFADSEATLTLKFLSGMYPVGDLILAGLALLLFLSLKGSRLGTSWKTFTISFAVYAIADLFYTYQLYAGTYQTGSVTDVFWYAGQLIMAYGFYQQIRLLQP